MRKACIIILIVCLVVLISVIAYAFSFCHWVLSVAFVCCELIVFAAWWLHHDKYKI